MLRASRAKPFESLSVLMQSFSIFLLDTADLPSQVSALEARKNLSRNNLTISTHVVIEPGGK